VKGHREGRRVRFSLRAEAPGLGELLGWALSGGGEEALAAGSSPHHDQAATRPIPTKTARRARPAEVASLQDKWSGAAMMGPRAGTPSGLVNDLARAPSGSTSARRPDDLEDYLL
jgi:hypothetical protein